MDTSTLVRPIRVMVADDSSDIREMLRLWLDLEDGFEVVAEARDGAEASRRAEETRPDVLLLDLSMPGTGGLGIIPTVKQSSPETRILVFSAFALSEQGRRSAELGADGLVPKGTSPDVVLQQIGEVCAR